MHKKYNMKTKFYELRKKDEEYYHELTQEKYDEIVNEIRKTTEDNGSYYRTTLKDCTFNESVKKNLFAKRYTINRLATNPHIITDMTATAAINRPVYRFKYVDEETKKNMGLSSYIPHNLNSDQIQFLKDRLKTYKSDPSVLYFLYKKLLSLHANKGWIRISLLELITLYDTTIDELVGAMDDLIANKILANTSITLATSTTRRGTLTEVAYEICMGTIVNSDKEYENRMKEAENDEIIFSCAKELAQEYPYRENSKFISEMTRLKAKLESMPGFNEEDEALHEIPKKVPVSDKIKEAIQDIAREQVNSLMYPAEKAAYVYNYKQEHNRAAYHELNDEDIDTVEALQAKIASYIKSYTDKKREQQQKMSKDKDKALEERNQAVSIIDKQVDEANTLKEKIAFLEDKIEKQDKEIHSLKAKLKANKEFSDKFAMNAQDQFQIFYMKVTELANNFIKKPRYEQMKATETGAFITGVSMAGIEMNRAIQDFECTGGTPPDLVK